jgi:hypothetical protein
MGQRSVPEELRDVLLTNHPFVKASRWMVDTADQVTTKAQDWYRTAKKALQTPPRRTKDINLPRERGRVVRKR